VYSLNLRLDRFVQRTRMRCLKQSTFTMVLLLEWMFRHGWQYDNSSNIYRMRLRNLVCTSSNRTLFLPAQKGQRSNSEDDIDWKLDC
jgi:hypothetical protein